MGTRCTKVKVSEVVRRIGVCLMLSPFALALMQSANASEIEVAQADTADPKKTQKDAALPPIYYSDEVLPAEVLKTRNSLLLAARSGDLEKLKPILAANKVKPLVSFGDDGDPIAYWKDSSIDGTGRDILAEMIKVFSSGFVQINRGTADAMYIWPYHFVYPLDKLNPEQEVELYLLVPAEYREDMEAAGGYIGFRAGIDPNGSLIFFVAGD